MIVPWSISESDIEKHSRFGIDTTEQLLYDLGMDVKRYGFQVDPRSVMTADPNDTNEQFGYTHRSVITGEVCSGIRYIGLARQDGKWRRFIDRLLDLPIK